MSSRLLLSPTALKLLLVVLPVAALALYYYTFAAERYVSETTVTVRQANHEASALPGVALLLGGINPPSREDTIFVRQYVHSLDLLRQIEPRLHLREHYANGTRDPFLRLRPEATQEDFLEYFRSRVEVSFDEGTSLLTIRAQAFDPEFARRLATELLRESEAFVNAFSQGIAREQLKFGESELQNAAKRLSDSKARVIAFQDKNDVLDPVAQAKASGALLAELQARQSRLETEVRSLRSYLNDSAPQVSALQAELNALRQQIRIERDKPLRGAKDAQLNQLAAQFRELGMQVAFAEDAYKVSLAAVENARIDAIRKIKTLVVLESPALAESPAYPRRAYSLGTLFVVCCLLYGIARLVIVTIQDHQD